MISYSQPKANPERKDIQGQDGPQKIRKVISNNIYVIHEPNRNLLWFKILPLDAKQYRQSIKGYLKVETKPLANNASLHLQSRKVN